MLDSNGKRAAAEGLTWVLDRLDTNWQWYRRDGQWNYEAVTLTRKVADGTISTTADGAFAKIDADVDYGRYQLEIVSRRPERPVRQRDLQCRLVHGGERGREPRDPRRRSRPRRATSRATPPSCASPPSRAARRSSRCCRAASSPCRRSTFPTAAAKPTSRSATAGAPAPTSPPCSIVRWTRSLKRMPSRAIGVQWLGLDQADEHAEGRAEHAREDQVRHHAHRAREG